MMRLPMWEKLITLKTSVHLQRFTRRLTQGTITLCQAIKTMIFSMNNYLDQYHHHSIKSSSLKDLEEFLWLDRLRWNYKIDLNFVIQKPKRRENFNHFLILLWVNELAEIYLNIMTKIVKGRRIGIREKSENILKMQYTLCEIGLIVNFGFGIESWNLTNF